MGCVEEGVSLWATCMHQNGGVTLPFDDTNRSGRFGVFCYIAVDKSPIIGCEWDELLLKNGDSEDCSKWAAALGNLTVGVIWTLWSSHDRDLTYVQLACEKLSINFSVYAAGVV